MCQSPGKACCIHNLVPAAWQSAHHCYPRIREEESSASLSVLGVMFRALHKQSQSSYSVLFPKIREGCTSLENPMDGGAWLATVYWVAKTQARLSDFTFTFHFQALGKEMATLSSVLAWRIPGTEEPSGCRLRGHTELDTTEAT